MTTSPKAHPEAHGNCSCGEEVLTKNLSLGELLSRAQQSTTGIDVWLHTRHPHLAQAVAGAAERLGENVATFARHAVADFVETATDEEWAQLISAVRDHDDPGFACLERMLLKQLPREGGS